MLYGFTIPGGDVTDLPALAREAEEAGWDGVFIPDCICIDPKLAPGASSFDPWVALTAMAMVTSKVRLGTMVTPLSRRRPWKVARETASLDRVSSGRLVLSVGLGALDDLGFGGVGEATDRKTRAELMDEGLDIVEGLWSGKPFSYSGKHYNLAEMTFQPTPVQTPRIPVWVVGAWPRRKSMERVLRWDGLLPNKLDEQGHSAVTPDDIRAMKGYIDEHRTLSTPFDIVMEGETPGDDPGQAAAHVQSFIDAGITWWLEAMWSYFDGTAEQVRKRIRQGPPRSE